MIAIGGCDYCGEFCSQLGVMSVELIDVDVTEEDLDPADLVPIPGETEADREDRLYDLCRIKEEELRTSLGRTHSDLVHRRLACAVRDGYDYSPADHVKPWHDAAGQPLSDCPNCGDDTEMDLGEWDSTLDHTTCVECWEDIAGGAVLLKRRATTAVTATTDAAIMPGIHLSTEPADRPRVEAAFAAYLQEPLPIRWVRSPVEVVRALLDAASFDPAGPWSLWTADEQLARTIDERDFSREGIPTPHSDAIARTLGAGIASLDVSRGEQPWIIAEILADSGQFDPRPALLGALEAAGRPLVADAALVRLLSEIHASCGPLVVLPTEIVVSERPLLLKVDEHGRPHSEAGPAIGYGDGFTVYARHGIAVPGWLVDEPERLSASAIDAEPNIEVRRVMIERFGAERLIREGGAELVHEDETGRLWRRPFEHQTTGRWGRRVPAHEPIVMVEVINSTPEPDGTRRTYFLRVPPSMTTARGAVAWTFGMDGRAYGPDVQS